jgi:hypothetical protein
LRLMGLARFPLPPSSTVCQSWCLSFSFRLFVCCTSRTPSRTRITSKRNQWRSSGSHLKTSWAKWSSGEKYLAHCNPTNCPWAVCVCVYSSHSCLAQGPAHL